MLLSEQRLVHGGLIQCRTLGHRRTSVSHWPCTNTCPDFSFEITLKIKKSFPVPNWLLGRILSFSHVCVQTVMRHTVINTDASSIIFYCCFCDNGIIHSQRHPHQMWYWWKELCLKPRERNLDEPCGAGKNFDSIPSKSLQLGELIFFSIHIEIALSKWMFRFWWAAYLTTSPYSTLTNFRFNSFFNKAIECGFELLTVATTST